MPWVLREGFLDLHQISCSLTASRRHGQSSSSKSNHHSTRKYLRVERILGPGHSVVQCPSSWWGFHLTGCADFARSLNPIFRCNAKKSDLCKFVHDTHTTESSGTRGRVNVNGTDMWWVTQIIWESHIKCQRDWYQDWQTHWPNNLSLNLRATQIHSNPRERS